MGADEPRLVASELTVLLAGCRWGPLLLAVPGLGIGGRVAALVIGTLVVAPLLAPVVVKPEILGSALAVGPLVLRELLLGGTLALAAMLPWAVAHSVGALLDAGQGPRNRAAASLYGALALALFFGLGEARSVLLTVAASYELVPLATSAQLPQSGLGSVPGVIRLSGQLLWLAIRLGLPLLGAQLLAELLVALPGRWLPPTVHLPAGRPSPVRSLIWLGVLLLGVHTLFPEFRKLILIGPTLLR